MAILMLYAFAIQSRASCGPSNEKSATHHISAGPDHVAYALESENRIKEVERNHRQAMNRISSSRRQERSQSSSFTNPFL